MVNVNALRTPLLYQEPAGGDPDALNQPPDEWTDGVPVRAEVRSPTGSENVTARQVQATISHVVTVRRRKTWLPLPTGRFLLETPDYNPTPRVLNVRAAFDPTGTNEWVSCLCEEQVS